MENPVREKFEEIKKTVFVTENNLRISRIPPKAKERFIALANEEFESDYGMLIKFLLDFHDGIISHPNEQLSARIDVLAEQFVLLKEEVNGLKKQPEEGITLLNGKKIGVKRNAIS